MRPGLTARIGSLAGAAVLAGGVLVFSTGMASASTGAGDPLYVSGSAAPTNAGTSCATARYMTISTAVSAAARGGTIVVCPGTYHEQVSVAKPLRLLGQHAVIDEAGVTPTATVTVPRMGTLPIYAAVLITSSEVRISGFTVRDAQGEGILAAGVTGAIHEVSVLSNVVVNNDLGGGVPAKSAYFECQASGEIPGDCGEGVHFIAVANSTIHGNVITGNSGGVLLTDETGPTHGNWITNNVVTGNLYDCGITAPGHNPSALSSTGKRQPSVAGVYNNMIEHNVITGNGLLGEGAGVLFANAGPGTASYNNLVAYNYIVGNELSGVTMHAHTLGGPGSDLSAPGFEDLSGNSVVSNVIGTNNIGGDPLDSSPTDMVTTGVLVFSGGTPVSVRIADNRISDNHVGIWLSKPVTATGVHDNTFVHDFTRISSGN